jgi:AcrR family transcriptional regulator
VQAIASEKEKTLPPKFLQKRDQILECAAATFNQRGVRGTTLADIAVSVGLNLTSIRHYFLKKEDLVAAAYLRSIEAHAAFIAEAKKAGPREARVRDLVRRYFEFRRRIRTGSAPEVIIFGDLRSLTGAHANEVWPGYVSLFRNVREVVADREEIESDRVRVNARAHTLLWQCLRTVFWLPHYEVSDFDRVETRFVDVLLNGLGTPSWACRSSVAPLPESAPPDKRSRESFLMAATELINEQGYRGASVERIAARLNVTKGSFYHHIDAKVDLVVECFKRNLELLKEAQRNAIAAEPLGLDQAFAAVAALVRRQQTPAGPLLRNSALMSVKEETRDDMLRQINLIGARFTDMVADGIADGSARACDARIAGEMLMAQINSAAQLRKFAQGITADSSVDLYVKPLFNGLFASA